MEKEGFDIEDLEKEKKQEVKDSWSEMKEGEEKKETKKYETFEELKDGHRTVLAEWNQIEKKYDAEIRTTLAGLFGKEGVTGKGRIITDTFMDPDWSEIEAAKYAIDFVTDSRRIWLMFNRRLKDYRYAVIKLLNINYHSLLMIHKLREKVQEYKDKEEQEPKEEPEKEEEPLTEEEKQRFMKELHKRIGEYNEAYRSRNYNLSWQKKGKVMLLPGKSRIKKEIAIKEFNEKKEGELKDLKNPQ